MSVLAILASSVFAVWVPARERKKAAADERRARLELITTRSEPAGLLLRVNYFPQFRHVGMSAQVKMLDRANAILMGGRADHNAATMVDGSHLRPTFDGYFLNGEGAVRLLPLYDDTYFTAYFFLMPNNEPGLPVGIVKKVHIKIEIVTDAGETLYSGTEIISPIDAL